MSSPRPVGADTAIALIELAQDESNFYVDDYSSSHETIEDICKLATKVNTIINGGGTLNKDDREFWNKAAKIFKQATEITGQLTSSGSGYNPPSFLYLKKMTEALNQGTGTKMWQIHPEMEDWWACQYNTTAGQNKCLEIAEKLWDMRKHYAEEISHLPVADMLNRPQYYKKFEPTPSEQETGYEDIADHMLVQEVHREGADLRKIGQEAIKRAIADPAKAYLVGNVRGAIPDNSMKNEISSAYESAKNNLSQQNSTVNTGDQTLPRKTM
jgi:hypothetical protein